MKSNKFRILILAIVAVLAQSTCVYAASDSEDDYTKDELNNLEPGFEWKDIDKSNYKVNSYINSYSSSITPKEAAENEDSSDSTSTTTDTASNTTDSAGAKNVIVSTQPSTGNRGDYWGKISGGKWMLIEQGVPVIGWKMVKGIWYYMDMEGIMQTGWLNDGQNWYYLNSNGAMASNTYVGGYYLGYNGVMQ